LFTYIQLVERKMLLNVYTCGYLYSFLCNGERQRPQALLSSFLSHYQQPALHLTWCWVTMVLYLNVQPL